MKGGFRAFSDLPLRQKGLVVVAIPVVSLLVVLAAMVFVQRAQQEAERECGIRRKCSANCSWR